MQFKDIIGHDEIKKRLINSVTNNRISHAQLFYGAEGTHKLALAIAYAQYILCTDKKEHDSCGVCPSCQKINKLQHPDVHFYYPLPGKDYIEKSSAHWSNLLSQNDAHVSLEAWGQELEAENKQFTIYTEQTLEIIKEVGMKSFESEYKIIIIWLVEKLYRGAVSKILKSLEEPNDKTVFILVTESYEDVITTIISRTQLIKVNKYSDNEIRNALIDKYHADTIRASEIARISDGNFNYALNLFNQGVDNSELTLFVKFTRTAFNYSRTGKGYKDLTSCVDEISKLGREKIKDFLRFSLLMFQQSLYLNKKATDLTRITNDESEFLTKFQQFITPANIEIIYNETNTAIYHIESNGYAMLVLTDYAIKIGKALTLK